MVRLVDLHMYRIYIIKEYFIFNYYFLFPMAIKTDFNLYS